MHQDTRQLFRAGLAIFLSGAVAAVWALTLGGGISRQGPHSNSGWLALMVAMGCLPLGTLTLLLALAKLIGGRKR
ncbi:MAG TPA: hypothetical protein VMQ60_04460 [Acidobacteriaceae bacterium]|jgi:hypothetical protein|nr:hypothetical protein [Acidobacteriaceae bacterium]